MNKLTQFFRGWKAFDYIFCTAGVICPIVSAVIFNSSVWQCLSTILVIIYCFFSAKGIYFANIIGLASGLMYAYVAFAAHLYGEVIILLCVALPLTIASIFTWHKNKQKNKHDNHMVTVAKVGFKEIILVIISQIIMGVGYYFILQAFNTESLVLSTISMATSVVGYYFTVRRCEYAFWAYIANGLVLLVLYSILSVSDTAYIAVLLMPVFTLISDAYGTINWAKLKKEQRQTGKEFQIN